MRRSISVKESKSQLQDASRQAVIPTRMESKYIQRILLWKTRSLQKARTAALRVTEDIPAEAADRRRLRLAMAS